MLLVESMRHSMLTDPLVSLDLIKLDAFWRLIVQQPLDHIARTLGDDIRERVRRVDYTLLGVVLIWRFKRRRADQ